MQRTGTAMAAAAAAALLLTACSAVGPEEPDEPSAPTTTAGPTQDPPPTSAAPTEEPTDDTSEPPSAGSPLPADYPWEPRAEPPPQNDGAVDGEPWIGGLSTRDVDGFVEIAHDGEPTYAVTGVEIYEEGPDQSRVVVTYEGGTGLSGLNLSVAGATDFPPDVVLPGGVDTGLVFLTGAHEPLGGGLEPGTVVEPPAGSRIAGVSIGAPEPEMGTGLYVGLEEGAVLWAVVDHPGVLVLVVTDPEATG
ncbi:hypothetical protein [Georgenia subflava]|uniref:Uncharacterized protein n=1 Tax=Georgenia subflava TaxID=1622177 RepID=A0A6N7EJ89_9MICO|nr:hypothetical protein [Georgenia subflava]MPV36256.1 hypothetical protein [Georgenia subflava]